MRFATEWFERGTLIESATCGRSDVWVTRSPIAEAKDLYRMVRYGDCTIASIRSLISVPPNIEARLLAYVGSYPEDAGRIRRVLRFREEVRREFEQLVEHFGSGLTSDEKEIYYYAEASAQVAD